MELKSDVQRARAVLEDALVDLVYDGLAELKPVMHGGTAIWRCYGGNRFSRDIDFYVDVSKAGESEFQKNVHKLLLDKGYQIIEEKYNNKTDTIHFIVRGYGTTGKLDITLGGFAGEAVEYARVDGTRKIIYALGPEAILNEKIAAYSDKFGKGTAEIHDLYDMLILKDRIQSPSATMVRKLTKLLSLVENVPPENEKELSNLLLGGVAPSFKDTIKLLKAWLDKHTK